MLRKLLIGFIFCFCLESALACANNEVFVEKSTSPEYKEGTCLSKKTSITLKKGECIVLKPKNASATKKCGPYSDRKAIKGGLRRLIERLIGVLRLHFYGNQCMNLLFYEYCFGLVDNALYPISTGDIEHSDTPIVEGQKTNSIKNN